eukprot:gene7076-9660_t
MNLTKSTVRKVARVMTSASTASKASISQFRCGLVGASLNLPSKLQVPGTRAFSLTKLLTSEIAHEQANDAEISQEYLDVKKMILKNFKLHEADGSGIVTLTREFKNEKIEVKYDVQAFASYEEMAHEAEDFENENGELDEEAEQFGIKFEISITKPDNNKLIFSSIATNKFKIQNIQFLPAGADPEDLNVYGGPEYSELDEELKNGFFDFLAERNIDDDLSYFIVSHSQLKENEEYARWLQKVLHFTSN